MKNVQGVAAPLHIDAGDCAPRAADQKEPVTLLAEFGSHGSQRFGDIGDARLLAAGHIAQFQRAQLRADAPPDDTAVNLGQLHRRAADVANKAVGTGPAQKDALSRQAGLFAPVDDPKFQTCFGLNFALEVVAVCGLAHGCGGNASQRAGLHRDGQLGKAAQRA